MRKGHQTAEPQGLTQSFRDSWVPGMAVKHSSKARPWCSHTNCRSPSSSQCGCYYVLCQCPRRHYWSATSVWPPGEWSCCRLCKRQGALGSLDSQYGSWLELEKWTVHWRWAPLQSAFPFLCSPHSAHSAQLKFMSSRLTDCSLVTWNVWRWRCWQSKVSFIT